MIDISLFEKIVDKFENIARRPICEGSLDKDFMEQGTFDYNYLICNDCDYRIVGITFHGSSKTIKTFKKFTNIHELYSYIDSIFISNHYYVEEIKNTYKIGNDKNNKTIRKYESPIPINPESKTYLQKIALLT